MDQNDLHLAGLFNADTAWDSASKIELVQSEPTPKEKPYATWLSADDVFREHPEPKWMLPELQIGPGRASCFAAYAGCGKTFAAQALELAVLTGRTAWGFFRTRKGRVRHIDRDQGMGTARRFERIRRGMGIDVDELRGNFELSLFPDINLVEPKAYEKWVEVAKGWDLVVVDSLRTLLPGIDENDSIVQENLLLLAKVSEETGASCLLIHHFGKTSEEREGLERLRGSSGIAAALGSVFGMSGSGSTPRKVEHVKQHPDSGTQAQDVFYLAMVLGDPLQDPRPVTIELRTEQQVKPPVSPEQELRAVEEDILEFLRKNELASQVEILSALGRRGSTTRATLDRMVRTGIIKMQSGARGSKMYAIHNT